MYHIVGNLILRLNYYAFQVIFSISIHPTKHLIRQRQKCQLSAYGIQFLFPCRMSYILKTILLQTLCNKPERGVSKSAINLTCHWKKPFGHKETYAHLCRLIWAFTVCTNKPCADPGIFVRGGPGPMARKQPEQHFFLVLNLFYRLQRGSNGFITEKTILFQGSRGGPTFSRGGPHFLQGGGGGGGFKC